MKAGTEGRDSGFVDHLLDQVDMYQIALVYLSAQHWGLISHWNSMLAVRCWQANAKQVQVVVGLEKQGSSRSRRSRSLSRPPAWKKHLGLRQASQGSDLYNKTTDVATIGDKLTGWKEQLQRETKSAVGKAVGAYLAQHE